MYNRYLFFMIVALCLFVPAQKADAQCFASAGNPMGGSANLGVMNKQALRVMAFYRYHFASDYFEGDEKYRGDAARIYSSANYNYMGALFGYGITHRVSAELETGYYLNKTIHYQKLDLSQKGFGLSNALVSMKYAFYHNTDNRFEIAGAAGVSMPYRRSLQEVDNVELPYDAQPSTASWGMVLQSYVIKENSFKSVRFFWVNRFEKNFMNPDGYVFGNVFSTSGFFSRHFVFGQGKFKDWTLILQLRYQQVSPNEGYKPNASGGRMLFGSPQVNCSINETWNISFLWEQPLYQYYHGIQLGQNHAFLVNVARDFSLAQKPSAP